MSLIFIVGTTIVLTLANTFFGLGKVLNVDHGR
jgi:hypothetical protein